MGKILREPMNCIADEPGSAQLLRIVYVSLAVRPLAAAEFHLLEEVSLRCNVEAGITGLLIAQGPYFYGLMEAPSAQLLERMEVIITDDRHRSLRILDESTVSTRRFLGWRLLRVPILGSGAPEALPRPDFIFDLSRRLSSH